MTDDTLNAVLRRIITEPDVDLHRLVYADRLDELREHERAEFVRDSIATGQNDPRFLQLCTNDMIRLFPEVKPPLIVRHRRGFVDSVETSAATFLKHADALIWHETQTVECVACRGTGLSDAPNGDTARKWPCDACRMRGNFGSRPCPPTAQPIRRVVLTTPPESTGNINQFALWKKMVRGEPWLSHRWPGVEFVLPSGTGAVSDDGEVVAPAPGMTWEERERFLEANDDYNT
jgi:uncharacterized protein (TIGR02996 family)